MASVASSIYLAGEASYEYGDALIRVLGDVDALEAEWGTARRDGRLMAVTAFTPTGSAVPGIRDADPIPVNPDGVRVVRLAATKDRVAAGWVARAK
jgi:hypothetical protein